MVKNGNKVRLEFMPWIAKKLGHSDRKWLILEESWRPGLTMQALLESLGERYPEFGKFAYDAQSASLTGEVAITINGLFVELKGGLGRELLPGDVVVFLPAFAGGLGREYQSRGGE